MPDDVQIALDADDLSRLESLVNAGTKPTPAQLQDWLFKALCSNAGPDLRQAALAIDAGAAVDEPTMIRDRSDADSYYTFLNLAAASGHLDACRLLLDRGADPNASSYAIDDHWEEDAGEDQEEPEPIDPETALEAAARAGRREVYDWLWSLTKPKFRKRAEKLKTW